MSQSSRALEWPSGAAAAMDSPFYFYAAAFVIWLGVSIGVLELITRLSNAPTKKPEAKAE